MFFNCAFQLISIKQQVCFDNIIFFYLEKRIYSSSYGFFDIEILLPTF